jgi:acetoin utilization deacetylase AcuC-like enzyme
MVFEWARHLGVPVAFALAGGYRTSALELDGVAELHLLTFHAAAAG